MRCPSCDRSVPRHAAVCPACGESALQQGDAVELVLADGRRVRVTEPITLGRAADNAVQLDDPSVSRHHARVVPIEAGACLEDVGSRYGTFVDGRRVTSAEPLRHGAEIRLGDAVLAVERPRQEWEAGETVVVVPRADETGEQTD